MRNWVELKSNDVLKVFSKYSFDQEMRNALQNATSFLETMDYQSEMTEEQIDVHHHLATVIMANEDRILNYLLKLSKSLRIK